MAEKHEYLKVSFWMKPENQFWENNPMMTEETKEKYRARLKEQIKQEGKNRAHKLDTI